MNQTLTKHKNIYSFKGLKSFPLVCAFSDRLSDLGFGSNPKQLKSNRKKFLKNLGIDYKNLVCAKQMHNSVVSYVSDKHKGRGATSRKNALGACDGMVTDKPKIPLAVLSADCLSIFLYDTKNSAISILHVGWRGSYKNIIEKTVILMKKKFKTYPKDVIVAFGPAIRSCCYEVGPEFKKYFKNKLIKKDRRLYLDLIEFNKKILIKLGVKRSNILDSKICTSCNNSFFSYRKEGLGAGRIMSVMMLVK